MRAVVQPNMMIPFAPSKEASSRTCKDLDLDVIMRVYQPDLKKMKTWKAPKAEMVK